jgi:acyl dehydratase
MLPTFAIALAQYGGPQLGLPGVDLTQVLHAEQSLELDAPLPMAGTVEVTRTVTDVFDKGSGKLVVSTWDAVGDASFRTRSSVFIRGAGGFGGARGTSTRVAFPDRAPDVEHRYRTSADQALRYRRTGDENPLHWDPEFAARGGFPRPILHGLATYGISVRLLGVDPVSVAGRFTQPVFPGDELVVSAWMADGEVLFRTSAEGRLAIDDGRAVPRS